MSALKWICPTVTDLDTGGPRSSLFLMVTSMRPTTGSSPVTGKPSASASFMKGGLSNYQLPTGRNGECARLSLGAERENWSLRELRRAGAQNRAFESGVAPDYIVATQGATRTRKICMYPNVPVYNGSGSTDDQANFQCQQRKKDALIDELEIGKQFETSTKAVIEPGAD